MLDTNAIILAALASGGIFTVAVKLIDTFANRYKSDAEVGRLFRDELRGEITRLQAATAALQERCDKLEAEVAIERTQSVTEHAARMEAEALANELAATNDRLSQECSTMKAKIAKLEREVKDLRLNLEPRAVP